MRLPKSNSVGASLFPSFFDDSRFADYRRWI
jgi:hypothetical protein